MKTLTKKDINIALNHDFDSNAILVLPNCYIELCPPKSNPYDKYIYYMKELRMNYNVNIDGMQPEIWVIDEDFRLQDLLKKYIKIRCN